MWNIIFYFDNDEKKEKKYRMKYKLQRRKVSVIKCGEQWKIIDIKCTVALSRFINILLSVNSLLKDLHIFLNTITRLSLIISLLIETSSFSDESHSLISRKWINL